MHLAANGMERKENNFLIFQKEQNFPIKLEFYNNHTFFSE